MTNAAIIQTITKGIDKEPYLTTSAKLSLTPRQIIPALKIYLSEKFIPGLKYLQCCKYYPKLNLK